ncbi:N-acetylmuramoyl-L-alanine amidase [Streptacidiphilus sp. PB12-B1b]|uniref:N-acetylmuramoyl-L-alanine amidase n=1 Tax=Streptacidiphilus sp. PB12-B1b TaxID=2705012 RepID=UPI0015F89191|nr:N-acetylmuramoyl-L-alanine amidase [Streptacidiphilus sp. PB12-B1b]QMU75681.1 N-acetylmuramoyl-L-alanine amidase [Streptacidiphilus sp. PB12-B1b]
MPSDQPFDSPLDPPLDQSSDRPSDRYDSGSGSGPGGRQRGIRAATLVIVLAALVPVCFAGWLGWRALHGGGGGSGTVAVASTAGASASRRSGSDAAASASASASAKAPVAGTASGAASASAGAGSAALPLAGKVVVIDPGHNPDNYQHPSQINALVKVGNGSKACDTTGTETDAGYPEADFTLDVARRARALLEAEGAKVVFTQDGNLPWGPCVTQRAAIGNLAHADAAISIHGDGAGADQYGFHVILPALVDAGGADTGPIVGPSRTLGLDVRSAFHSATGEPFATYINNGTGLDVRSDLGGLNLSTVPKVFIECGNMRNSTDAGRMTSPAWRQRAAQGIASGLSAFLLHPN